MTLILIATGQTIVVLRGGIDLSVGGTLSLATAIAATRAEDGAVRRAAAVARRHPRRRDCRRRHQRRAHLGSPAPAVRGHAGDLVDRRRDRPDHPAGQPVERAARPGSRPATRPSSTSCRRPSLLFAGAAGLVGVVPPDTLGVPHPGGRLGRARRLPQSRVAHPHERRGLRAWPGSSRRSPACSSRPRPGPGRRSSGPSSSCPRSPPS